MTLTLQSQLRKSVAFIFSVDIQGLSVQHSRSINSMMFSAYELSRELSDNLRWAIPGFLTLVRNSSAIPLLIIELTTMYVVYCAIDLQCSLQSYLQRLLSPVERLSRSMAGQSDSFPICVASVQWGDGPLDDQAASPIWQYCPH